MAEEANNFNNNEKQQSQIYEHNPDSKVERVNALLNYIRKHSPISVWQLSKELDIPHSTIYYAIRDMEFAGLIKTRISISKRNRSVRIVYIPKKEVEENDE